jgi:hypothetical protein
MDGQCQQRLGKSLEPSGRIPFTFTVSYQSFYLVPFHEPLPVHLAGPSNFPSTNIFFPFEGDDISGISEIEFGI